LADIHAQAVARERSVTKPSWATSLSADQRINGALDSGIVREVSGDALRSPTDPRSRLQRPDKKTLVG